MKTLQNKKFLQASYDKDVEKAKERLIKKITPHLYSFCDKWGLGFLAGNGGWTVTFPENKVVGRPFYLNYITSATDGRWLIDHFAPELSDALETDVGRCCIGCQIDNYEQTKIFVGKYFWVEEYLDPEESIVRLCDLPSQEQGIITFGPISEQLAIAVYGEYKKDPDLGLDLIFGCLPQQ